MYLLNEYAAFWTKNLFCAALSVLQRQTTTAVYGQRVMEKCISQCVIVLTLYLIACLLNSFHTPCASVTITVTFSLAFSQSLH